MGSIHIRLQSIRWNMTAKKTSYIWNVWNASNDMFGIMAHVVHRLALLGVSLFSKRWIHGGGLWGLNWRSLLIFLWKFRGLGFWCTTISHSWFTSIIHNIHIRFLRIRHTLFFFHRGIQLGVSHRCSDRYSILRLRYLLLVNILRHTNHRPLVRGWFKLSVYGKNGQQSINLKCPSIKDWHARSCKYHSLGPKISGFGRQLLRVQHQLPRSSIWAKTNNSYMGWRMFLRPWLAKYPQTR